MAEHDDDLLTEEEMAALEAEEGEEVDGSASLEEDAEAWARSGWKEQGMAAADDDEDDEPDAQQEEPAPQEEPKEPEQPRVSTSELDKQLSDLRKQDDELLDQYDDGDLTREELAAARAELQSKADDLTSSKALEMARAEQEMKAWKASVGGYLKEYPGLKDDKVIEAFDAEVRAVTSSRAYASMTYEQQLALAHKRLAATGEDIGLDVPPLKGRKQADPDPKPGKKSEAKGEDLGGVPKTLARVPASDRTDEDGGKYSALQKIVDRGTPDEIEEALGRLSEEERNRFSSMQT
jgi:hypothetical protein